MNMPRFCIVGHSGAGKSTTAALIRDAANERGLSCAVVKIAAPLYELQDVFYTRLGRRLAAGQQDQQLLEQFATHIRELDPRFLIDDFLHRTQWSTADVLVNDDVRSWDLDYPELRKRDWTAIRISTTDEQRRARLTAQGYLSLSDASTVGVDNVDVDFDIRNDSTRNDLRHCIKTILNEVMSC